MLKPARGVSKLCKAKLSLWLRPTFHSWLPKVVKASRGIQFNSLQYPKCWSDFAVAALRKAELGFSMILSFACQAAARDTRLQRIKALLFLPR